MSMEEERRPLLNRDRVRQLWTFSAENYGHSTRHVPQVSIDDSDMDDGSEAEDGDHSGLCLVPVSGAVHSIQYGSSDASVSPGTPGLARGASVSGQQFPQMINPGSRPEWDHNSRSRPRQERRHPVLDLPFGLPSSHISDQEDVVGLHAGISLRSPSNAVPFIATAAAAAMASDAQLQETATARGGDFRSSWRLGSSSPKRQVAARVDLSRDDNAETFPQPWTPEEEAHPAAEPAVVHSAFYAPDCVMEHCLCVSEPELYFLGRPKPISCSNLQQESAAAGVKGEQVEGKPNLSPSHQNDPVGSTGLYEEPPSPRTPRPSQLLGDYLLPSYGSMGHQSTGSSRNSNTMPGFRPLGFFVSGVFKENVPAKEVKDPVLTLFRLLCLLCGVCWVPHHSIAETLQRWFGGGRRSFGGSHGRGRFVNVSRSLINVTQPWISPPDVCVSILARCLDPLDALCL